MAELSLKLYNPRPDYIKCIQHTHADLQKTSWCNKKIYSFDWVFQDIDHAIYSIQSGSRQVPCPDCVNKINMVLRLYEYKDL